MQLEQSVARILKIGSVLSTALLAIGVSAYLLVPATEAGWLAIHAGLLIVLGTPIVRVVVSMVVFAQQREWFFVLMTLAVLGVLAASVVTAFA